VSAFRSPIASPLCRNFYQGGDEAPAEYRVAGESGPDHKVFQIEVGLTDTWRRAKGAQKKRPNNVRRGAPWSNWSARKRKAEAACQKR